MFRFIRHTWFLGHSVETNRSLSYSGIGERGWLHKCECGERWAR